MKVKEDFKTKKFWVSFLLGFLLSIITILIFG
jgi:hypothetical protein